jgi:hypothetical protein
VSNIPNAPLLNNQPTSPNTATPVIPNITPESQDALNHIKPVPKAEIAPQDHVEPTVAEAQFLAHSGEVNKLADIEAGSSRIVSVGTKILAFGLTLQSLYSIYKSIIFVFVDIPNFELSLAAGLLDRDQVILLAVKGVLEILTAIISIFFALRLVHVNKGTAKFIDKSIGVAILFGNAVIIDFFRRIEVDLVLTDIFQLLIEYLTNLPLRLLSLIPFL